jgi:anti-sigma B factor antagonist
LSRLSIRVTESDIEQGAICLTLSGDLDLATRQDLIAAVEPLLARIPRKIVIDLAGVKVLDSAGIGALVSVWKAANPAGCGVEVRNPSRLAYWQLELSGLLEFFAVQAT